LAEEISWKQGCSCRKAALLLVPRPGLVLLAPTPQCIPHTMHTPHNAYPATLDHGQALTRQTRCEYARVQLCCPHTSLATTAIRQDAQAARAELAHSCGAGRKGRAHKGRAHKGRAHKGRAHKDRAHKGRAHKGRAHKGRAHKGRAHKGRAHKGRAHKGRAHKDRAHKGRAHKGRARHLSS